MWPFSPRKAPRPPEDWINKYVGPVSYTDWTDEEIAEMSKAIRVHGQPDSEGWHRIARICLNSMRNRAAIEMVAREIETCLNSERDPDRPIEGGHYMNGMPHWCMWLEYARPAVRFYVEKVRK